MEREQADLGLHVQRPRCPYCRDDVQPSQAKVACDGCMAWHHAECWSAHGACSGCGFATPSGPRPQPDSPPVVEAPPTCMVRACPESPLDLPGGVPYCREHQRGRLQALLGWYTGPAYVSYGCVALALCVSLMGFMLAGELAALGAVFLPGVALDLGLRRWKRKRLGELLDALEGGAGLEAQ
ncbi:MAG: hypothetical protein R3F62_26840 [Planctomycetota bacterium]